MKRFLVLSAILLLLCLSLPALAVDDPAFSVKITGALEQDELVLDWQIRANREGLVLGRIQAAYLVYDNTVLQLMLWDGSSPLDDSELIERFSPFGQIGNGGVINAGVGVLAALSSGGETGYLGLNVGNASRTYACPQGQYVSLEQVRFTYREGKSVADLHSGSLRLMTIAELNALAQSAAIALNTNEKGGTSYYYLLHVGGVSQGSDALNAPEFSYPGSDKTKDGAETEDPGETEDEELKETETGNTGNNNSGQNNATGTKKDTVISEDILDDNNVPLDTITGGQAIAFADVQSGAWFYDAIQFVTGQGLMNGMSGGLFSPNLPMTRAMFATVLHRLAKEPAAAANTFSDVPAGQWYSAAIGWAGGEGLITGYGGNIFGLNDNITREQVVVILYRYAELQGQEMGQPAGLDKYEDADKISVWARDAMQWAVGSGIISGRTATSLAPKGAVTRAEIAQILARQYEIF